MLATAAVAALDASAVVNRLNETEVLWGDEGARLSVVPVTRPVLSRPIAGRPALSCWWRRLVVLQRCAAGNLPETRRF